MAQFDRVETDELSVAGVDRFAVEQPVIHRLSANPSTAQINAAIRELMEAMVNNGEAQYSLDNPSE